MGAEELPDTDHAAVLQIVSVDTGALQGQHGAWQDRGHDMVEMGAVQTWKVLMALLGRDTGTAQAPRGGGRISNTT